jgi:hypothetical protein
MQDAVNPPPGRLSSLASLSATAYST